MGVDLYYMPLSAPCRSVLLLAKSIGLELTPKLCNVLTGENRTPEYLKMNPQHTIPTIDDDGFYLWESRAILIYLATKYGPAALYPSDPKERAVVDQRLFFDMGTLFERFNQCALPVIFAGKPAADDAISKVIEALGWLESFFGDNKYVAGAKQTVADFAVASSIAAIESVDLVDFMPYPKLRTWLAACKVEMPGYAELNDDGAKSLADLYKQAKEKMA